MKTASGSCFCHKVSFSVELPSKWVAHCHCSMCRRAHGAAFVTFVGMADTKVRIDDGESVLRWFRSSKEAERGFCSHCGSTLFFRSENWPGELHIALANFETPVDRAPQAHAYFDNRVDWFAITDELPKKNAPTS